MSLLKKANKKKIILAFTFLLLSISILLGGGKITKYIKNRLFGAGESWNYNSDRVYLSWQNSTISGVENKNHIRVFAFEGETICFGSDVYNSGFDLEGTEIVNSTNEDVGSIDIVMYDLSGKATPIDIRKGGMGHIGNLAKEKAAKNLKSPYGDEEYTPYTYTVSETGVYTFEFRSYNGSDNVRNFRSKTTQLLEPKDNPSWVSAWDITVFDEANNKKTGRTYADYLSLQARNDVKEDYYILTGDSYIYQMRFNDTAPNTYVIFANNKGLTDIATGNIVYKSVKDINNDNIYTRMGVNYTYPTTKNTDITKNFYIFFEKPNEDLKGQLYDDALIPDPASNIRFIDTVTYEKETGVEVTEVGTYEGVGGYFAFDVKGATTATLNLNFHIKDKDGHEQSFAPLEISNVVTPYKTNYFYWDGKDGNGKVIPAGSYSLDEIVYTVTTKAGEVHFPVIDMEFAKEGITFTRLNNIYNHDGTKLDAENTIYDKTRNVVYYDESPIYYGDRVASTGQSESEVTQARGKFSEEDALGNKYYKYNNLSYSSGERGEMSLYNNYGKKQKLRIGDHSHTSNVIDFTKSYEDQQELIDYLDSEKNPVGLSERYDMNNTTTDYAISNYWTFMPGETVSPNKDSMIIVNPGEKNIFNLFAQVFYDENSDGTLDIQNDGDHLLYGIDLKLYKETEDKTPLDGKKYYYTEGTGANATVKETTDFSSEETVYELIKTVEIPLEGKYIFSGLLYDNVKGTKYLYQVIRPNPNYIVTSNSSKPTGDEKTGIYKLYAYDKESYGTEIQTFTVGGDGITFDGYDDKIVTAIDVGYNYITQSSSFEIKKEWKIEDNSKVSRPEAVVYEVSYNLAGQTGVYEERVLSGMYAWDNKYEYLETKIKGKTVTDYYVSAEYYIYGDKIFKHRYSYDKESGVYESLVGEDYYFSLSDYYKNHRDAKTNSTDGNYTLNNIPDFNNDGKGGVDDLQLIPQSSWKKALATGSSSTSDVISPFNSVIDRSFGTGNTQITITNATNPGAIEVYKYTGAIDDNNYLSGATFRIYKGDLNIVKGKVDAFNNAQLALNNASADDKEEAQIRFDEAAKELADIQIDSGTTRINGRIVFPGLDTNLTYTVRERFAPSGYQILNEYYEVKPKGSDGDGLKFNANSYALVNVPNAQANSNLEVRKKISGRSWQEHDSFDFPISINEASDISINYYDKSLYSTDETNLDDLVKNFADAFTKDSKNHITINYDSDYINVNGNVSVDTKSYEGLLESGIDYETKEASFYGVKFPAAGTYTFTMSEKQIEDPTFVISPRIYTITIDVMRVLNNKDDIGANEEVRLDNSHLEATISKIVYQEKANGVSMPVSGSTILFVNTYEVQETNLTTHYRIQKNFTGRENNEWLVNDSFNFIIEGNDVETKEALKNNNIVISGDVISNADGSKKVTISRDTKNHEATINGIDFSGINFPVEYSDDEPSTKPVIYYLNIKEEIPTGANNNTYKGINYSDDIYTLKITLENGFNEQGETDGIIDKITFDLYKNYDFKDADSNVPIGTCVINQSLDDEGNVVKAETHDTRKGSHTMTFTNTYDTTMATWSPKINKTLNGRDWTSGDVFKFIITWTDKDKKGVIMPKVTYVDASPHEDLKEGTSYEASFNQIKFTLPGTYHFNIKEQFNNVNGIKVNTSSYTATVTVTDNNEGELLLSVDSDSTYNYVNSYTESGSFNLSITKTLEGRKWVDKDKFNFEIIPDNVTKEAIANGVISLPSTLGKSNSDGSYNVSISNKDNKLNESTFMKELGAITFTKGDKESQQYKFTIKENLNGLTGIIPVEDEVILDISVSRKLDEDTNVPTGELDVVATYTTDNEIYKVPSDEGTNVVIPFKNQAYIEEEFTVKKSLIGKDWANEESFIMILELVNGNEKNIESLNASNYKQVVLTKEKQEETLKFKFYQPGEYTFKIIENIPSKVPSGSFYDTSTYYITIKVADNGSGALTTTKSIVKQVEKETEEANEILFVNVYKTGSLTISNKVIGNDADKDKEFNYTITLSDVTINGIYGDVEFKNGIATFTLKDSESKKITDLPSGITYRVIEKEANSDNFVTTVTNESGSIVEDTNIDVEYINSKNIIVIPNTGDNIIKWIAIMLISLICLFVITYKFKQKNY